MSWAARVPFTARRYSTGMWAYAGRYGDAAACYGSVGLVWDLREVVPSGLAPGVAAAAPAGSSAGRCGRGWAWGGPYRVDTATPEPRGAVT